MRSTLKFGSAKDVGFPSGHYFGKRCSNIPSPQRQGLRTTQILHIVRGLLSWNCKQRLEISSSASTASFFLNPPLNLGSNQI